ncbi:MAG: hypothetical protein JSV82_03500 [Planctomycetota bacterium]|nr:MAG: hypothetical protein JSV82_03500 [Planctomycetota bacterium]
MNKKLAKSRRAFLRNLAFGGVAFALTRVLRASDNNIGQTVLLPEPIQVSLMPQPDAPTWQVAFSPVSGRMATAAGEVGKSDNGDIGYIKLYINSSQYPEDFQIYWETDGDITEIFRLAWSPSEKALAFTAFSGSTTTKTGEWWLYVLDVVSGTVRKVLKIGELNQGQEQKLVDIPEQMGMAWFGENKVCLTKTDQSIIAVDINEGHIETLTPALPQNCYICGPVSISYQKLRFLKRRRLSGGGWENEVCEFNGSEIISLGTIPLIGDAELSLGGKHAFIGSETNDNFYVIFDLSQMASVNELPRVAKGGTYMHVYRPVTVLEGKQLILLESIVEVSTIPRFAPGRIVSTRL